MPWQALGGAIGVTVTAGRGSNTQETEKGDSSQMTRNCMEMALKALYFEVDQTSPDQHKVGLITKV